jgi:class 3 adenylate cyclase
MLLSVPNYRKQAFQRAWHFRSSISRMQLESHRREITALFCDLRGFTGFTESADAEDVMALLRDYHAAIGEIIIKYNGTLERYAGDGVMVVFNHRVPVENPGRAHGP